MEVNKYIGILHRFNGDDYNGADCIGLCRLFYKEHGWKETFTDGKEITPDWQKKEPYRLIRYLNTNFDHTKDFNDLKRGDIVLINYDGDYHLGIYLNYGSVLAMQIPCLEGHSMSTIYNSRFWKPLFVRGYKRRK